MEGIDVLGQALWTSAVKNDNTIDNSILLDHFNNVPSYWRFNATVGYQITPQVRAQVTVNNLFDKQPNDAQLFSGNFGTYDLIGRRYLVSVTTTF